MQPYLFPYLGYYQLVAAVDKFVFYDDVNYIKNGWINRNRLLLSGSVNYFTVPLAGASPFQKIHDVKIQNNGIWRRKLLQSMSQSYGKAPCFAAVFDLASSVLERSTDSISDMAKDSVIKVAEYLGLDTEFVETSRLYDNEHLTGTERVLDICQKTQASHYINLPGGRDLYSSDYFDKAGIQLQFIEPELMPYPQSKPPFTPGLSILDVLMWNDIPSVRALLNNRAEPAHA